MKGEEGMVENTEGPIQGFIPSSNSLERSLGFASVTGFDLELDAAADLDVAMSLKWVVSPTCGMIRLIVEYCLALVLEIQVRWL